MNGSARRAPRWRVALPLLGGLVILGLLVAAVATAEVIASGRLLPYTPMTVERVRVLGGTELWVARESLTDLDLLNALILAAGTVVAGLAAVRMEARRAVQFFALLCAGLAFLCLDELLALHETIGYNLDFLADLPGANSPEDVLFALYAVPAVAFFLVYRDLIGVSRLGTRLVLAGVGLFGVSALLDVTDALLDEQWIEPPASALLIAGFTLVAARHLASLPPDAGTQVGDASPPGTSDAGRDRSSAARA